MEEAVLAYLIVFPKIIEKIPFLKTEHFYKNAHQIIFDAISKADQPDLLQITRLLKDTDELEQIGGVYHLTAITNRLQHFHSIEYAARIIQQMFIKREIIRLSSNAIRDAYEDTMDCIELFEKVNQEFSELESVFDPSNSSINLISNKLTEKEHFDKEIKGQQFSGLSTGYSHLDEHFRFKPASLVITLGHDNVGKTFAMIQLAVCSNVLHGWKWLLACMENSEGRIRQDIIQARSAKHISRLTKEEYDHWYQWAEDNFIILKIEDQITAEKLLKTAKSIHQKNNYQAFFIDPYNALSLPKSKDKYFNSHEYHYEVTNQMRHFIKQTGASLYVSAHPVTEALRAKHKDGDYQGFPMPPQKADIEGGGKFANRADDFLIIHRYTGHATEGNITHIHVRKVKDQQTGGRPTIHDEPVKLRTVKGYFGLYDLEGKSPIFNISLSSQFPTIKNDSPPF